MEQKKSSCLTHHHAENMHKSYAISNPQTGNAQARPPHPIFRTQPYAPCLHISLKHCCCTFINSWQSIGQAKPLELFTAISICHISDTNTVELVHLPTLLLHGTVFKSWEVHYASRCLEVSRRRRTYNKPHCRKTDDSASPEKLGPLSNYLLQKAGTHNPGLCCSI